MATPTNPKIRRLTQSFASFEGKIRIRTGALLFDDPGDTSAILLVEHDGIWSDEPFWTPPGGGVEFGESLEEALLREVREETGLDVEVGPLRYVLEFIRPPVHAVSFYFQCRAAARSQNVEPADGERLPIAGRDPELGDQQLIRSVRRVPLAGLSGLNLYPEGLGDWLRDDAPRGFPDGVRFVGTLR